MSQNSPVVEYANTKITDLATQGIFLSAMTAFLIGNDFRKRLSDLEITKEHPVWPFLEEYLKEKYHINLSGYITAPQSNDEA